MYKFPERLKELRLERELSQRELAAAIGFTQPNIVYWETGKQIPSATAVIAIAQFFEVSADYLLGLED